jgi:hypothetical protein
MKGVDYTMAGRGIGYNELSESLQRMIDLGGMGGGSGSGNVIVNVTPEYVYSVAFSEQDLIENIVFVDGEYITSFNPKNDTLAVYKDGLRLAEGIDYAINPNNVSIDSLKGGWIITDEVETIFTFVVKTNSTASLGVGIAKDEEIYEMFGLTPPIAE